VKVPEPNSTFVEPTVPVFRILAKNHRVDSNEYVVEEMIEK
jgi:hypothetical protein